MNYLAHLYLADDHPHSLLGNLAGDFLRGAAVVAPELREGIARHRAVDAFTDAHPAVARSRARLSPRWGLYARVLVDVFYDHVLASQWKQHHPEPLEHFAIRVYRTLGAHAHLLPPRLAEAAPRMIRHNWLLAYATVEGVGEILRRMSGRSRRGMDLAPAAADLSRELAALQADFAEFFPQLRAHVGFAKP